MFKSEVYISTFLDYPVNIYYDSRETTGGFISDKVKLAIAIRFLAGGDAMDLGVMFDISYGHCRVIILEVLKRWINATDIGHIDIESYLNDETDSAKVSKGFSKRSNGVLTGAIGAIDGCLVKIQKPSWRFDRIQNILSFL